MVQESWDSHHGNLSQQRLLYIYTKNTTNPIAKNMKNFREAIVTNLFGLPPPNRHLKSQASFHHHSTIPPTEKKEKCCQNMQTLFQQPKASRNEV